MTVVLIDNLVVVLMNRVSVRCLVVTPMTGVSVEGLVVVFT